MDGSWVNLLRKGDSQAPTSPVRREILSKTPYRSRAEVAKSLRVSERTPQMRGLGVRKGVKKVAGIRGRSSTSALGLRGLGARERKAQSRQEDEAEGLTVSGDRGHVVNGSDDCELLQIRSELEVALRVHSEAQCRLEEQQALIDELTNERDSLLRANGLDHTPSSSHSREELEFHLQGLRDALDDATREKRVLVNELNAEREKGQRVQALEESLSETASSKSQLEEALHEKDEQIEGLLAHVKDLRSEVSLLSSHMTDHVTFGSKGHTHLHRPHSNNTLIKDLERLALRNAELSEALSATRHSRSVLERETVSLKRVLLEVKSRNEELEQSVSEAVDERREAGERLRATEEEGRRRMDALQQQVNTAMDSKAEQVREILDMSEQLQGSLSTLNREKDLLATSLRQEAAYNQRLEEEKASVELYLKQTQERTKSLEAELQTLQEKQVSEIDTKCREIDRMKERLEGEVRGIEDGKVRLEGALRRAEGDRDKMAAQLEKVRGELKEMRVASSQLQEDKMALQTDVARGQQEGQKHEARIKSLRAELAGVESHCAQLKKEVSEVREFEIARAKRQVESVTNRLTQSTRLVHQLETEKEMLNARVGSLEGQLSREQAEREKEMEMAEERLRQVTSDFDSALSELEGTQTTNLLLQQKVSDLESEAGGLKEQLENRVELTNEMKALLDQRAARIRQLERAVESHSFEQISADSSGLLNSTTGSEGEEPLAGGNCPPDSSSSLLCPSTGSRPPSPRRLASGRPTTPVKFTSPGAEVIHLKQRLSESRQSCVRLEVQVASLKTEVAKLQGSLQAMVAIRDHLSEEGQQLQNCNRCLEEERTALLNERDELVSQLDSAKREMGSKVGQLQAEQEHLLTTCQDLQGRLTELEEVCTSKDDELFSLEQLLHSTKEQLETGEVTVYHLQRQLAVARQHVGVAQGETLQMKEVMGEEAGLLTIETQQCSHELTGLRAEALEVQETSRITDAVNRTRSSQIEEREANVSRLLAEVEVLRARKTVVLQYLDSKEKEEKSREEVGGEEVHRLRERNQQMQSELAAVRYQLQQLQERHSNKVAELSALLEEKESLLRTGGRRGEGDGVSGYEEAEAKPGRERGRKGREGRRVERLQQKLKTQTRQTNYLRLRLGYTLSELRLYKHLKREMDVRLDTLQEGLLTSQLQHRQCLERLQLAEQLGLASGCP